eukprot:4164942-Alexandrium_andersonii.AAC.1
MPLCHVCPQTLVVLPPPSGPPPPSSARSRPHAPRYETPANAPRRAAARRATEFTCRAPRGPCRQSPSSAIGRGSSAATAAGRSVRGGRARSAATELRSAD